MKEHPRIQKLLDWVVKVLFYFAAQFYRLFDPPDWEKKHGKDNDDGG